MPLPLAASAPKGSFVVNIGTGAAVIGLVGRKFGQISGKNGRFLQDHCPIVSYPSCMRTLSTLLIVAGILTTVIVALKATPAGPESHYPSAMGGLHIALPENMKALPRELIPLP